MTSAAGSSEGSSERGGADVDPVGVKQSLRAIRNMILAGRFTPGQKVHQAELAEELNVSRVPVREALSRLSAEGLLQYRPNLGFTVTRFSAEQLSEIYLMRRVLETELLRTVDFDDIDPIALGACNEQLRTVDHRQAPDVYQDLNVAFHFMVFAASPLALVRHEVERLWNMSAYYQSLHLFVIEDASGLASEHDQIVEAVRGRDHEALISASDGHRAGTERVRHLLSRL